MRSSLTHSPPFILWNCGFTWLAGLLRRRLVQKASCSWALVPTKSMQF